MNPEDIKIKLIEYVIENSFLENINQENIPLDESLLDTGKLDSYGIIELTEFVESNWNFVIPDQEFIIENFGSINKITEYILRKKNPRMYPK